MQKIAIIGAGTMGSGIAQLCLQHGLTVWLFDVNSEQTHKAKASIEKNLNRLAEKGKLTGDVADLMQNLHLSSVYENLKDAELVIEAALERLDVKREIFKALSDVCPEAILASNTSTLSVSVIAGSCPKPENVIGMHFFNPAPLMPLVEVIVGDLTSDQTKNSVVNLAKHLGRTPVVCKDTPGFIVNRVARPYYNENLRMLGEGVSSVPVLDRIMQGAGFRMGAFELMDFIGMDINYASTKSVYEAYHHDPKYRPHYIQAKMVDSGRLGRKTGSGFYSYQDKT